MSTVISAPPIQHVDPPPPPDLSYCDNPRPSGGQGFWVGCRRQSLGGGGPASSLLFRRESIFINSVASHVNICSSLRAAAPVRCPDVPPPNLSLPNPQREQFFISVFHWDVGVFCAFGLEMLINGTPRPHYADVLSFMARPARAPSESSKLNAKSASFDKSGPNKKAKCFDQAASHPPADS